MNLSLTEFLNYPVKPELIDSKYVKFRFYLVMLDNLADERTIIKIS